MAERKRKFTATIESGPRGGALVTIPFDVGGAFGTPGRVKVRATFDGVTYRGSIVPMGGVHMLGVRRDIRNQIGKDVGDTVAVTVEPDLAPRTVTVPEDLAALLRKDKTARQRFEGLSYTHRREFVEWIDEAKKPETRERRLQKTIAMLRDGKTR